MTKITNTDTRTSREATIITHPSNLSWCIALWAAPEYGFSKVDGNGHGWQVVRANGGSYTYNNSMMGGFRDSRAEVEERAVNAGYALV